MSSTHGRSLNWNKLEGNLTNILGDPGAVSRAGRKCETKVFKHSWKSPWVPTLTGLFPNGQANAGSWLGTKNALYYCVQSANSFSWVLHLPWYAPSSARLNGLFFSLLAKQNFEFLVFWLTNAFYGCISLWPFGVTEASKLFTIDRANKLVSSTPNDSNLVLTRSD